MVVALAAAAVITTLAGGCAGMGGAGGRGPAPGEEAWAIRCAAFNGPDRFERARWCEQALKSYPDLKAELVQVLHNEDGSVVYYGRYARRFDTRTHNEVFVPDPRPALELIRSLSVMVQGQPAWPFRLAVLEPLPGGPGEAPEWDLRHARGYWSWQVAVFYNTETMQQRKEAAVAYCRLLREQGEEAYYHHGPVNSSVTIGTFPKQAIVEMQREDPLSGVLTATSKIVDERMLALQRRFPHNLENGHLIYEIERGPSGEVASRVPHASFPVRIPEQSPPQFDSTGRGR